jgi:thiosulfate/3-mercaptopyruvate sulfurtransferase
VSDVLVSPAWVRDRLGGLRVLDVRGEVVKSEPRYRAYPDRYRDGHIPGAVFADWRVDFTDRSSPVPVTIAAPGQFAQDATRLGIGADTMVVAYDEYHNVLAGRIVWALRSYGHMKAHILDGGLAAWKAERLPVETGEVVPPHADPAYPPPARLEGLIDLDVMRDRMGNGVQVVDARAAAEYSGEESHARRAGHIPGALNMPYRMLIGADGRFLAPELLRRRLEEHGVDLERPIVAYCNGGVSATAVAHAVEIAGAPRPIVSDGSWNEWGNRDDTPAETGS